MMWVIVNYWRSKRHWRNGDTGWRDHKCHLWSLRTIRGLNNGKLDTLSQIHEGERTDSVSVPTLLEACFVSGFTWEIKTWLKKALRDSPGPTECPPGHLFVVPSLRGDGWVEYAHNSLPSSSTGMAPFRSWLPSLSVSTCGHRLRGVIRIGSGEMLQADLGNSPKDTNSHGSSYKFMVDLKRRRAPAFKVEQRIWLSTKDLLLRMESRKPAVRREAEAQSREGSQVALAQSLPGCRPNPWKPQ
ncbi:uncharacterized protein LOC133510966 isoform X5 [Syngnathoides biaculeatus]|nr:uncharacterized protein LOC133510966 isoform X5 [Syngnathoides biaculeatus]